MTPDDPSDEAFDNASHDALDDAFHDPGHAEIRALLASVRPTEALPGDVARRLDATLADLRNADLRNADLRNAGSPTGRHDEVVPLRRRWAPRLLAAAAAVVVLGGAGTVYLQQADDGGSADTAAGTAQRQRPTDQGQETAPDRTDGGRQSDPGALPEVRPGHLRADAERVLAAQPEGFALRKPTGDSGSAPLSGSPGAACPGPAAVRGPSVPVRYGDRPAALVLRPSATADRRTVEVWSCDGSTLLTETVVSGLR
jgi:hypothetical protein